MENSDIELPEEIETSSNGTSLFLKAEGSDGVALTLRTTERKKLRERVAYLTLSQIEKLMTALKRIQFSITRQQWETAHPVK